MSTSLFTALLLVILPFIALQSDSAENGKVAVKVEVTACDGWQYGSASNTLQLQLKGEYDSSHFFYVNQFGPLPIDGYTDIFMVELTMNEDHIGYYDHLFSVVISLSDSFGYCLKRLAINLYGSKNDTYYVFDEYDFGIGLIVSHHCKYSYKSISTHKPLIKCIDDYLELYTEYKRGIYKLVVHSCNNNQSKGIDAINMKNNVYTTLMGKNINRNSYITTDFEYLDHYMVGDVNLKYLGHLIAGNIMIHQHLRYGYPLYTRDIVGTIIGIKLEPVDKDKYGSYGTKNDNNHNNNNYGGYILFDEKAVDEIGIIINGEHRKIYNSMLLGMGKYLVTFLHFHDRIKVTEKQSAEILIYGNIGTMNVNVYVIFEEYTHLYQLPFIVHGEPASLPTHPPTSAIPKYTDDKGNKYDSKTELEYKGKKSWINWFDAHKECMSLYGTSLTSIHSKDEAFLMEGFVGYSRAWIGFIDFDINHMQMNKDGVCYVNNFNDECQWKWIDGSNVDYILWTKDMYNSYAFEDCAYIDAQHGGGWNNADCHSLQISKYICSSPYWFINSKRKFELNLDVEVDAPYGHIPDISIISIGNDNSKYALCIDSISINPLYDYHHINNNMTNITDLEMQHVVLELTNSWIGGVGHDKYLNGIIKYPVCKTEVIAMDVLYETSITELVDNKRMVPGQKCINEQRVDDEDRKTYCLIDAASGTGQLSIFRISSDGMHDVSLASSSNVTLHTGTNTTITTENEFRFNRRYEIYFANVVNGTVSITPIKPIVLSPLIPGNLWFDIEQNVDFTKYIDDEYTMYDKQQYVRAQGALIQCSGKSYVPTSHILPYEISVNVITITVDIISHLKLTLCEEFLNTNNSKVIYKENIATQISDNQAIGCDFHWFKPIYIPNTNKTSDCSEEQRISINMNLDYLPHCNSKNVSLYDGCQCTSKLCWCSDQYGNKIVHPSPIKIPNNATWQQTCRLYLNCSNSQIVL